MRNYKFFWTQATYYYLIVKAETKEEARKEFDKQQSQGVLAYDHCEGLSDQEVEVEEVPS